MEKEKVNYLAIILAFCVVIAGLGGFWIGTYFEDKNDGKSNVTETTGMTEKEIDNLGRKLFEKTSYANDYWDELYFYNEDKLDHKSMDNETKLMVAYMNIPNAYILEETLMSIPEEPSNYTGKAYMVAKDNFEKSYKELFGASEKINYTSFETYSEESKTCELQNNQIVCKNNGFGGRGSAGTLYVNYEKTELVDNSIVVYTSLLGYNNWNAGEFGVIYSDYNMNNQIADKEITENVEETLFKEFGDKASKYKLTFNKDTNDNWYWVSTELVK